MAIGAQQLRVDHPLRVDAQAGIVRYRWDATLEEWYLNDSRGVEHGFTPMLQTCFTSDGTRKPPASRFSLESREGCLRLNRTADDFLALV